MLRKCRSARTRHQLALSTSQNLKPVACSLKHTCCVIDSGCALPDTFGSALLILPAMLVRRGKYSVADPLFVEERRPVLVARKLRRGAEAGDIVLVNAREKNRSLRGEVTRVIGTSEDPRNVYEALS